MTDRERLLALAMDAFRLCIGVPRKNFADADIVRFVTNRAMQEGEDR